MAKKALGRGLGALFPSEDSDDVRGIVSVEISCIRPNPYQPREDYSDSEISTLVDSVKQKGVIQPIVVRKRGEVYELVCGERRFRAARKAGLKKIPVVVRNLIDREVLEVALIENLQRKDLNPIEEAKAYNRLLKEFNLTQSSVAKLVGKKRPTVANRLRLLRLPSTIQSMIMRGEISEGHARAILSLDDENKMLSLVNEIRKRNLSVRDIEKLTQKRGKVREKKKKKDTFTVEAERLLREKFGTRCSINRKGKAGKLIIEFYSKDDLIRIFDVLSIGID